MSIPHEQVTESVAVWQPGGGRKIVEKQCTEEEANVTREVFQRANAAGSFAYSPEVFAVHPRGSGRVVMHTDHVGEDLSRVPKARWMHKEARFKREVTKTLTHLASAGYEYTDLHPRNVCINERGHFYLIDYGSVRRNPSITPEDVSRAVDSIWRRATR